MAPHDQYSDVDHEPKSRLHFGMSGSKMAADTSYQEAADLKDDKHPGAEDYAGLQVVETGLEVAPSGLPEAAPSGLPEALPLHQQQHRAQYDEYNPWPQYSPPNTHSQSQLTTPGSYPYPVSAAQGSSPPYGGSGMAVADYQYHGGHNPFGPPQKPKAGGRICGLRKVVFWAVLAIVVFAVVAAVAIGVGVGLGTRSGATAAASNTPTPTASPSTTTWSLPAATATATAGPDQSVVCPTADRTEYSLTNSTSGQKFLVLCGRDYNSCCGAEDMYSVNTTTFEKCLQECSSQEGCMAVGWGNYYGVNTCWLKSAIGEPNWSKSWYSAVAE